MAGAPAARVPAVVAYRDGALVLLIDDVIVYLVPMIPQEVLRPENLSQGITDSH